MNIRNFITFVLRILGPLVPRMGDCQPNEQCPAPVGLNMCHLRCVRLKGCSYVMFSSLYRLCCLEQDTKAFDEIVIKMKQEDLIFTEPGCKKWDRILKTRDERIICISDLKKMDHIKNTKITANKPIAKEKTFFGPTEKTSMKRDEFVAEQLLMVKSSNPKDGRFYQRALSLKGEITIYPYMSYKNVVSLLYDVSSRSIYVAYYSSRKYKIVILENEKTWIRPYGTVKELQVITLDEMRQWLLFVKPPRSYDGIHRIHKGRKKRLLQDQGIKVYTMAVCSKKGIVYIGTTSIIYAYSYEGSKIKLIDLDFTSPLIMDPTGRYLYFNTQSVSSLCIHQYDTETEKMDCFIKDVPATAALAMNSEIMVVQSFNHEVNLFHLLNKRRITDLFLTNSYHMCIVHNLTRQFLTGG